MYSDYLKFLIEEQPDPVFVLPTTIVLVCTILKALYVMGILNISSTFVRNKKPRKFVHRRRVFQDRSVDEEAK